MSTLSATLTIILSGMALMHVILGYVFARRLRKLSRIEYGNSEPRAAVAMALRGADPFLSETLRKLVTQQYENFQVVIVVDHESDPAWEICKRVEDEFGSEKISVSSLQNPRETCSLKCSCLVQAVESLDDEVEIVAFADADVVPHKTWLRELVAPLADDTIGATTGNQWFDPTENNLGSLVRSVWNAGAIVPTVLLGHPWAGSCAMRREQLHSSGLLDKWKHSVVDDGPVAEAMHGIGLSIRFVPSLFMINRESCKLSFCWTYIRRMLTWSRLFESTYFLTVCHAIFLKGVVLSAATIVLVSLASQDWESSIFLLCGLFAFWVGNAIGYQLIATGVQRHSHDIPDKPKQRSLANWCLMLLAIPLTHLIYLVSAIRACWIKRIEWRKITYEVAAGGKVRMVEYQPYRIDEELDDSEGAIRSL